MTNQEKARASLEEAKKILLDARGRIEAGSSVAALERAQTGVDLALQALAHLPLEPEAADADTADAADAGDAADAADSTDANRAADRAAISSLLDDLSSQPDLTLRWAKEAIDPDLTMGQLEFGIEQALAEPEPATETVAIQIPDNFTFKGYDPERVALAPESKQFETLGDLGNWVKHWAHAKWSNRGVQVPFRFHDNYASDFTYKIAASTQDNLTVGLFADFGTGLYHSRYITKHLASDNCDAIVHLGDVYYAGTWNEFDRAYGHPWVHDLIKKAPLFSMNSNHEVYSKCIPFFAHLDKKRNLAPGLQEQEGSYFCISLKHYQIIGIDTAHPTVGRHKESRLNKWLARVLRRGKAEGKANILLSPDEAVHLPTLKYAGLGTRTKLLTQDLQPLVAENLIDLWFWGNVHYCALYQPHENVPFVSSCIGHAGYPYMRMDDSDLLPGMRSWVEWLETEPRFPKWTKVRPDVGNNGYCLLSLEPNRVVLTYRDWTNCTRRVAEIRKPGADLARYVRTVSHGDDREAKTKSSN